MIQESAVSVEERIEHDAEAEVVAFARGRSVACPRCGYDLRDIQTAKCPECGDALELVIRSTKTRFGWLILAMAPGCFSGVAACFVAVPVVITAWHGFRPNVGVPWPVVLADAFGFASAASVWFMYKHRQRILAWAARKQAWFAGGVWATHVTAFGLFLLAMVLTQ